MKNKVARLYGPRFVSVYSQLSDEDYINVIKTDLLSKCIKSKSKSIKK